jgi:hypothetical protein
VVQVSCAVFCVRGALVRFIQSMPQIADLMLETLDVRVHLIRRVEAVTGERGQRLWARDRLGHEQDDCKSRAGYGNLNERETLGPPA